ncbi:MAG: hypothetical protein ABL989_15030 [Gammaproteobacteria bacterium]
MIRFQIIERPGTDLHRKLVGAMRSGALQTFNATKRGSKVSHAKHPGWMNWSVSEGVITCEVISPRKPGHEWQFFHAFIGRLAARFAGDISAINIQFPEAEAGVTSRRARKKSRGR